MIVYDDLTLESALADPMIALVRRADGMDHQSFAVLLRSAAATHSVARSERSDGRADLQADLRATMAAATAVRKTHCGSACAW